MTSKITTYSGAEFVSDSKIKSLQNNQGGTKLPPCFILGETFEIRLTNNRITNYESSALERNDVLNS